MKFRHNIPQLSVLKMTLIIIKCKFTFGKACGSTITIHYSVRSISLFVFISYIYNTNLINKIILRHDWYVEHWKKQTGYF